MGSDSEEAARWHAERERIRRQVAEDEAAKRAVQYVKDTGNG